MLLKQALSAVFLGLCLSSSFSAEAAPIDWMCAAGADPSAFPQFYLYEAGVDGAGVSSILSFAIQYSPTGKRVPFRGDSSVSEALLCWLRTPESAKKDCGLEGGGARGLVFRLDGEPPAVMANFEWNAEQSQLEAIVSAGGEVLGPLKCLRAGP